MSQAPDFLVHEHTDVVGVVVVETVQPGAKLQGWVMDKDTTIEVEALDAIPLGHKVALTDLAPDDTILKYGHDIGKIIAPVRKGGHVHVHNAKTKRW